MAGSLRNERDDGAECVHVGLEFDKPKEEIKDKTSNETDAPPPSDPPPKGIGGASPKVDATPKVDAKPKVDATPKVAAIGSGAAEDAPGGGGGGGGGGGENATNAEAELNKCPPGHFSGTGVKPCEPCPAGAYMPNAGGRVCIRCAQGAFQNATGSVKCDECEG
ncbi:hypothetical protein T484DRAFT_1846114, partial [Baffinella frigidus]